MTSRPTDPLTAAQAERVSANVKLVYSIVGKYMRTYNMLHETHHAQIDDMEQEGMLGLIRAAQKFDESRGHRFSTYATQWIRSKIGRFLKQRLVCNGVDKSKNVIPTIIYEGENQEVTDMVHNRVVQESAYDRVRVGEAFDKMTPREADCTMTLVDGRILSDAASELGVCRERVRQIRDRVTAKLRLEQWHDSKRVEIRCANSATG